VDRVTMAALEKSQDAVLDQEKATELSRDATLEGGEVKDAAFIHANPADGDEAWVSLLSLPSLKCFF